MTIRRQAGPEELQASQMPSCLDTDLPTLMSIPGLLGWPIILYYGQEQIEGYMIGAGLAHDRSLEATSLSA